MKKLSRRDEQLLLCLIVVAIILAIYYLMIIPFKEKLKVANLDKEVARAEYENLINANNKPEIFQANLEKLIMVKTQKENVIPERIEKAQLISKAIDIEEMLPNKDITCEASGAEMLNKVCRNKVNVSFNITYTDLESLVSQITNLPQKTSIDNISFTIENNKLNGSMEVYFYSKSKA